MKNINDFSLEILCPLHHHHTYFMFLGHKVDLPGGPVAGADVPGDSGAGVDIP